MRKLYIILLLILLSSYGCSFTSWANYMDSENSPEWNIEQGISVLRDSDFKQASWKYVNEYTTISVQPIPLKPYTLTFGPAYLPIIPFFQFPLLYDLFSSSKETFMMRISVKSNNGKYFLDLSEVDALVVDNENISSIVFVDCDTSSIINWQPIDFFSMDTSKYLIELSSEGFTFQLGFSESIDQTDSIKVRIQGIYSNEKYLSIPELLLIRKGKFHFDNLKFGV